MIKFSRSAIEQYISCKRCFILTYKYKLRLPSFPFTLNSAVDNLCKNEFDYYRKKKQPHPLFEEHDIDAIPFAHEDLNKWRNNFQGISYTDNTTGVHFYGAVDDVWIQPDGKLIISDVKATSKKDFNWQETWNKWDYPKAYKRQLEMYQWLFRKNSFEVSDTAYLVYFNGLKNEPMFEKTLKFELHVVKLECKDDWVEAKIIEAKKLYDKDEMPSGSKNCGTCQYLKKRWHVNQTLTME